MVHSKPEYAESVKLLSYKQLRSLERMDRKKEREAKLLDLAKEGVVAGGRFGQGLMSNQIAGTAAFILGATALYPAWQPIVWSSLTVLAANIAEAWKTQIAPSITKTVQTIEPQGSPPPVTIPPSAGGPSIGTIVSWGIGVVDANGHRVDGHERWYNSASERDLAFALLQAPGLGVAYGDLWPNGPGTSYRKLIARVAPGGTEETGFQ